MVLSGTKKHHHIDMIFHMLRNTLPILVKRLMIHWQNVISKTTMSKWIMTTALRHICHSILSIGVWCSQWLLYLTLRRSWSPKLQTARSECSKMGVSVSPPNKEFTHHLGQIVQGQTEILGHSHCWLLQARDEQLSFCYADFDNIKQD